MKGRFEGRIVVIDVRLESVEALRFKGACSVIDFQCEDGFMKVSRQVCKLAYGLELTHRLRLTLARRRGRDLELRPRSSAHFNVRYELHCWHRTKKQLRSEGG